ncbi:MAG: preprotein translocase subunit SecE [Anaerovoracaceae bacterium]
MAKNKSKNRNKNSAVNSETPKKNKSAISKAVANNSGNVKKEKGGIGEYFKGVYIETKKVVWPTKAEIGSFTAVVVVACVFFATVFWAVDTAFLMLLQKLLGITI